jgi:outer membrane protein assembly factor BamC
MKSRSIVLGFAAVSLLAACSIFDRKPVDYKAGAVQIPPLEVPPDLTVPEADQRYTIPGANGERVASYSEYTRKAEQPCVAPASAPAAANPAPAATLLEKNGVKSISTGEPFDRSWRRVGLALDHAHLVTTDKDRSKGIFFVAAAADKGSKEKHPDYQVVVRESNGNCEVTVVDQNGKSDAETARLVDVVYQNLDKNDRGDAVRPPR